MENSLQLYIPTKPIDSWCSVCHDAEVHRRAALYCPNQRPICHQCYRKIQGHLQQAQPHHRSRMDNCLEFPPPRQLTDNYTWCSLCCDAEVPHRATLNSPKYGPLCRRCYKNIKELWEECKGIGRR